MKLQLQKIQADLKAARRAKDPDRWLDDLEPLAPHQVRLIRQWRSNGVSVDRLALVFDVEPSEVIKCLSR